ncbi:hypothetical protein CN03_11540 [Thalassolituus oleivorans]|uniref:hypothetical protein n=1 Tax=Thalassolituus oleivorans TaxID=187493 RepID=UPI00094948BA|nr:hypothetical protein [Thalassolituus oleivorans]APR67509.1 hypothetical protein CN03_11540 [Thalassolituus oleivorans]
MKFLILAIFGIYLVGCSSSASKGESTKKDLVVNDKKYDLIINASMRHASMDIPCIRLTSEINSHAQKDSNFELASYDRFLMTDGIRMGLSMNYNLIPSQQHQGKRYKEAYAKVVDICKNDESLSYLDALSIALSSTSTN